MSDSILPEFGFVVDAVGGVAEIQHNIIPAGFGPAGPRGINMSQNYYKTIDGQKYDSEMITLADQSVAGRGDGRISLEDAKLLLASVKDANKYTDIEKATMHYIRDHYHFTPASDQWFRTQIRSWAATRGWVGHAAKDSQAAAGPPQGETSGEAESHESYEQTPPPVSTPSSTQAAAEPPQAAPEPTQAAPEPPQAAPEPTQPSVASPGRRPSWLIPLAVSGAILVVIAAVVFWPSPPPPVEVSEREASQSPAQEVVAAPSTAETARLESQSPPQSPPPTESAETEKTPSVAEETSPAVGESAAVVQESQEPAPTEVARTASQVPPSESAKTERTPSQAEETTPAVVESAADVPKNQPSVAAERGAVGGTHRVQRGDTLWGIAATWYQDAFLWPQIYQANRARISNPDLIHPGTEITVPALQ